MLRSKRKYTRKEESVSMWFAAIFFIILFGGLTFVVFNMYEWYQALGIIALAVIAPFIFNLFNAEFEWISYILGYALCIISHTNIKSLDKDN